MKQLLYSFRSRQDEPGFLVVAIDARAFLLHLGSRQWIELGNPSPAGGDSHTSTCDAVTEKDSDQNLLQIQAVAGCAVKEEATDNTVIYCAVARQSKQLSIYRLKDWNVNDEPASVPPPLSVIQPHTIHQAPKRVSSMVLASSLRPVPILVTSDLAGDVFAYSLTHGSTLVTAKEAADEGQLRHRKLLLGHTASMLTGVAFCPDCTDNELPRYILTADRDEKIRVTHFPSTFDIHGFLFGHTAFVSCLAVLDKNLCLSCGGDSSLRVWNIETCKLLGTLHLQIGDGTGVPCDMCASAVEEVDGGGRIRVAVIYDRCTILDLFALSMPKNDFEDVQFEKVEQVHLPGQPLGLSNDGSTFFILVQEPHFLQVHDWRGQKCSVPASMQQCNTLAMEQEARLPTAILERDHEDELKMVKNEETRGPALLLPWNNADRKDVAFQKRKRQRSSRKSRKEHENDTSSKASVEDEPEKEETADVETSEAEPKHSNAESVE
jgi:tRNA (guanine-N(7)-)-methyltransferase subunit TRM82